MSFFRNSVYFISLKVVEKRKFKKKNVFMKRTTALDPNLAS